MHLLELKFKNMSRKIIQSNDSKLFLSGMGGAFNFLGGQN
jgi:hypothetical protein